MMAGTKERFEIGDRERELRDASAAAKTSSLSGWLIVLVLLLTLMVAS
jgi:hypothetical protein